MSFINSVEKSMNGIKALETSQLIFTDDNSTLNTSSGIQQAQSTGQDALNRSISAVSFNTTDGNLKLTTQGTGIADITQNLDGRYFILGSTLSESDIPNLSANKITSDTLDIARIPSLPYVETTGNETIAGIKTFSSLPECNTAPTTNDQLVNKLYVDNNIASNTANITTNTNDIATNTNNITTNTNNIATNTNDITTNANNITTLDGEVVKKTGNQTIGGIKTFSSLPECSTAPTTNDQLANKLYVDSNAGTPANMVTTDTLQNISGQKTFLNATTYFPYAINSYRILQTDTDSYIEQSGSASFIQQTQSGNKIVTEGNIGIGNPNPTIPLEIKKSTTYNDKVASFQRDSTSAGLEFRVESTPWGDTPIIDGYNGSNGLLNWSLRCNNFERIIFLPSGIIQASTNFSSSKFVWQNAGHHIDSFNPNGSGRNMYINWYAGTGIIINRTYHASDDRIKEDEEFIKDATQTLLKLRPQLYNKFSPEISGNTIKPDRTKPSHYESGLIAQEIYYDAPELRHIVEIGDMSGNKIIPSSDDPQQDPDYSDWGNMGASVNYIELIPYLIKSNQELHERIKILEKEIEDIKYIEMS